RAGGPRAVQAPVPARAKRVDARVTIPVTNPTLIVARSERRSFPLGEEGRGAEHRFLPRPESGLAGAKKLWARPEPYRKRGVNSTFLGRPATRPGRISPLSLPRR